MSIESFQRYLLLLRICLFWCLWVVDIIYIRRARFKTMIFFSVILKASFSWFNFTIMFSASSCRFSVCRICLFNAPRYFDTISAFWSFSILKVTAASWHRYFALMIDDLPRGMSSRIVDAVFFSITVWSLRFCRGNSFGHQKLRRILAFHFLFRFWN